MLIPLLIPLLQGNLNLGVNNTGEFNRGVAMFYLWQLCVECMITASYHVAFNRHVQQWDRQ